MDYSTYTYSLVVKVFQVMLQRKVQNGIERNEGAKMMELKFTVALLGIPNCARHCCYDVIERANERTRANTSYT